MVLKEDFLAHKLKEREDGHAYRRLQLPTGKIDFCSNDYLGIASHGLLEAISAKEESAPVDRFSPEKRLRHGSTGSRLLTGNYNRIEEAEKMITDFHGANSGLIYNSGYDANLGLLSSVPQRGDTILYDYLSHASIRDGIRLSFGQSFSFLHNDLEDLEKKIKLATGDVFVVTESVFSMDGDLAPLQGIAGLTEKYQAHLIVDEAHATGVIGAHGEGLVQHLGLADKCFARVHTFGKAIGCHGAIVVGSRTLREYLINFSRSFIYTTSLPESAILAIQASYRLFPGMQKQREQLQTLVTTFRQAPLDFEKPDSPTPIQAVIIPGNTNAREKAEKLRDKNLDVRSILYPSVPKGRERLRIVLHSFNSLQELEDLLFCLGSL